MRALVLLAVVAACGQNDIVVACFSVTDYDSCRCYTDDSGDFEEDASDRCTLTLLEGQGYCCATADFPDTADDHCYCARQHCARDADGCACKTDSHVPGMKAFPGASTLVQSCVASATEGCCQSGDSCTCSKGFLDRCPSDAQRVSSCSIDQNADACEGVFQGQRWNRVTTCR